MTIRTATEGDLFLVFRDGEFSQADWDGFLAKLDEFMTTAKYPAGVLTVLSHYARPNPLQREQLTQLRLAERARNVVRHAYVGNSREALAVLTGLRWMGETPFEEKAFDDVTAALEWLAEKVSISHVGRLSSRINGGYAR